MKLIITESQLRMIIENENKDDLFPIHIDMGEIQINKILRLYNKVKKSGNLKGIRIDGDLNFNNTEINDLDTDDYNNVLSFIEEIVLIDGDLVIPVNDNVEYHFNKLKKINGNLRSSDYKESLLFPQLEIVKGSIDLQNSSITELPKLREVDGYLHLSKSEIISLPKLNRVGGSLGLRQTNIDDLPKLESVGGKLVLMGTPLSTKIVNMSEEDRVEYMKKINVEGDILL